MLQQIDSAIGFSVVMLMISLIVTALVQVISALLDLRGRNLAAGLENLLRQVEPEFRKPLPNGKTIAQEIANAVVTHPSIAHAGTRAKAISQGELIRVLRDLCSAAPAIALDETAKAKLRTLLDQPVVRAVAGSAVASVSGLEHQVAQWFDTVMNRLSDIFTRTTRVITVTISALLVVVLQIDSGSILTQISRSPELRAKLSAASDSTFARADRIFDNSERAAAALADVRKNHATEAQVVAALDKIPPHLARCLEGRNALVDGTRSLANSAVLLAEFDDACQRQTQKAMGDSYNDVRSLHDDLQKFDLEIVPAAIAGQNVFDSPAHWWAAYRVRRHLMGILASIVLLSLGAPFWFNVLGQLSNLKPAIADRVSGSTHR